VPFGEEFTLLAVLKATDEMSKVLEKVDGSLNHFQQDVIKTASVAVESGAKIDEGLLQTASGADALELAAARTATAQDKLAAATRAQAEAEAALLQAREVVATEDELAAAADAVSAAQQKATAAATELKDARTALKAATKAKASEDELAQATAAVTAAEEKATLATRELTDARAQQAALVTPQDVEKAADALTAAERRAATATREATTAQERQAEVERAAAAANTESAVETDAAAAAQARLAQRQASSALGASALSKAMKYGALGVAAIGYESVKAAGNFQSMTQHLVTDAGESQKNLAMIQQGMLALSAQTGTSTAQMAAGMYHVESAGYHGAQALAVMKAAAEGAKVGNADLDTVSKALTGTMNAYNMSGSQATSMMNQLITAVGQGDMKMEDLASSLGNVAPVAAAAGISFAQIGAAIATMTAQNMSAQQATQDLAHTISSLQNPNAVQIKEMQALGLNSNQVSKSLGKVGLTGTLDALTQAVARNTKGGDVLISTFNASKQAAANAQTEIKAMPANLQKLAQAYLNGSITSKQWTTDLKGLSPVQASLMKQFASTADQTHKFNNLLTSGSPAAQTYNAAMSKLLGGTTGLKTALMLTGGRMGTFKSGVDAISGAAKKGGKDVDNWATIQSTFNQKIDRAKASIEAAGISIGTMLLPTVSKVAGAVAGVLGPMASWISHNQKIIGLIASIVGPALAVVGIIKTISAVTRLWAIAQGILDAVMDASPLTILVVLLAAVVGGLIYAYTHFKTFRDVVNDVGKFVASVFTGLWHALETAFHAIVHAAEATWHGLEAAWNAVVGAAKSVWNFLSGIWNAIANVTTSVWNSIVGFFAKWWPLLLMIFLPPIGVLISIWNHFHEQIEQTAKTVWNAVKGFFVAVWDFLKGAAQTDWNLIKTYIVQPIEAAYHWLVSVFQAINAAIVAAAHWLMGYIAQAWNLIYQYIVSPLEQAWHMVTRIFDDISNAIQTAINQTLHWLSGIGSWFVSIGEDIINGIISGIENAGSSLFSTLGNMAKSALNAAKSFLGIGSPSKLFRDEIGRWIPEGIAAGVQQHARVAQRAVATMAAALPASVSTSVTSSFAGIGAGLPALAGASSGGGGAAAITIDLRGAVVANQSAMDQLAATIGKRIATTIGPSAGLKFNGGML
jgi:TP901 family phage tail tape measure protein